MNKVLIAVSQANQEPWNSIWTNGQQNTWMASSANGVKVVNFYSKNAPLIIKKLDDFHEKNRYRRHISVWQGRLDKLFTGLISKNIPDYILDQSNDLLLINSWSTYFTLGRRYMGLYKWFLAQKEYNFLFTTNTSSYINQKKLFEVIQSFNEGHLVYAGFLIPEFEVNQFVSGAGKLLSRKVVEIIVNNSASYKHSYLEDVDLGHFMREKGISPISLSRIEIRNPQEVPDISEATLREEFHFRCKSFENPRKDAEIMLQLHERISDLK